jgi:cytochrome c nitrite reductase small subunit
VSRTAKVLIGIAIAFVALATIAAFVLFGPPAYAEKIAEPEFCRRCHVMDPQYNSYRRGSHSHLESCNDCHLPNDSFVRHWFWDGVVGVRDLVEFNLNLIPEHIEAKPRSQEWLEENCRRCHEDVISEIHPPAGKRCWECHRELYHDFDGREDPALRQPTWEDER